MRAIGIVLAILIATSAWAQQSAPEQSAAAVKIFASSADVMGLIAAAKSEIKPDQVLVSKHILQLAPYNLNMEYRPIPGPAAVHEKDAEIFYVIDGAGVIVTGGKLVNETRANPTNLTGTAIEGGTSQSIAKGDVVLVPENTAHQFSVVSKTLVLMSLHLPRPVTAPR